MTKLVKLLDESTAAWKVGKKLVDAQSSMIKYVVVRESSRMMSSAISLILLGFGLFLLSTISILGLGYWIAQVWGQPYLIFVVPILAMIIILALLWFGRAVLFRGFTKHIIRDLLD